MENETSVEYLDANQSAGDQSIWLDRRLINAVIDEAHRAADGCAAFLKSIGWNSDLCPKDDECKLSLNLALKIGAMMRLNEWQTNGLYEHVAGDLPTAEDILADLRGQRGTKRTITGSSLVLCTLRIRLRQMAWSRLPGCRGDVLVNGLNVESAIEPLALMLWRISGHRDGEGR